MPRYVRPQRKQRDNSIAWRRSAIVTAVLMCPTGAQMMTAGGPVALTIVGVAWVIASLAVMLYWTYER